MAVSSQLIVPAGLSVATGVGLMNHAYFGGGKGGVAGTADPPAGMRLGLALGGLLFMGGWALFVSVLATVEEADVDATAKVVGIAASAAVVMAAAALFFGRVRGFRMSLMAPLALSFMLGWAALAGSQSVDAHGEFELEKFAWAATAAVSVIASMMFVLPKQRSKVVVDGPGYALFLFGWSALATAHRL